MTLSFPSHRQTEATVFGVGVTLAVTAGVSIAMGHALPALVIAAAGSLGLLLSIASVRLIALPVSGMLLVVLGTATVVADSSTVISVSMRLVGLGVLAFWCRRAAPDRSPVATRWILPASISLGVYLLLSLGFHGAWSDLAFYGLGLALFAGSFTALGRHGDARTLTTSSMVALQLVLLTSILVGIAMPATGIEQGRLRGVMENANLLGFLAFLAGSMAVLGSVSRFLRVSGLIMSLICLAWTASRGSAVALAVVIVFVLLSRRPATLIITAALALVGGLLVLAYFPSAVDVLGGLLRDTDSRSGSLDSALEQWEASPLIGVGDLPANDFIASSPLRALANAGAGGLLVVLTLWATILRASWRQGLPAAALGIAAIGHSLLEGWLLSPIGSPLIMFCIVWTAHLHPIEKRQHVEVI